MTRPFELQPQELEQNLEEMVDVTISDLGSEFLLMPAGPGFIKYEDFRRAHETLKRHTRSFADFTTARVFDALLENSRAFCVLRAILGVTPPEWAELARSEYSEGIPQNAARTLDRKCREDTGYVERLDNRYRAQLARQNVKGGQPPGRSVTLKRIDALLRTAINCISQGAPKEVDGVIHRMAKFDTSEGIESVQYAAKENVPYAVLLYERYLGRPFAAHRDAVSELVGEVIENAIEDRLRKSGVTYRKTQRAERIPGFGQAPDFCIPDEINPAIVIEAKITSDDGTARDKVARIKVLETQRNQHVAEGRAHYEVVACIDGRGFRERREDMRQMLLILNGKVFTMATLDQLVTHTRIQEFVSTPGPN
jgi:hypothetical protein